MFICRDLEPVRRLLLRAEPETRSIYNTVFGRAGAKATWVRVDDREDPKVVLCRSWWLTMYAASRPAARRMLDALPARWNLNFSSTPSWVHDHVARTRNVRWTNPCVGYALLDPDRLVAHRGHRVGRLEPDDSRTVARYWPYHGGRGDSTYIKWRIRTGPTCAIRRRGRLVAWALTHGDGSMGFLHVLEEWRGRGMAKSVGTALARRVMERGWMPFLFIERKNRPSLKLTAQMGLEPVGRYTWFSSEPLKKRGGRA